MTLGSDAGLLSRPQRRTGDFTNPSATAEVYFLQRPDRPILNRIFELSFRVSAVGTLSASEALLLLHPQRRSANLFLFRWDARSLSQIQIFRGVGDRADLQTLRGVGDRTVLESDSRSLRHPQRRRLTL